MMSIYYASTPTRGNWFQTNQPEHESDDRAGDTVTSVCVTNEREIALQLQFDQHLSLYCGAAKPKLRGNQDIGFWEFFFGFLWFLKFTDNFGIVSSKMHSKTVTVLIPLK